MRAAVGRLLPQFLGMFDFLYASPNKHTFITSDQGLQKLEQQQGIIQGSELSMLFFSLYTHHPLSKYLDNINNHVLKYADDIYIYGSIDQVSSVYSLLEDEYTKIGLTFNPAKSELYLPRANGHSMRSNRLQRYWNRSRNAPTTCSVDLASNTTTTP